MSTLLARLGLSVLALLVAAGLGYVVGRGRGGLDEQTAAELARYRQDAPGIEAERDSLRVVVRDATARADSSEAASARWQARARQSERRADQERSEADGFRVLLADAASCPDSLGLVLQEAAARGRECAELRVAVAEQDSALAADSVARVALGQVVDAQRVRIGVDSTERVVMASLIDRLERAARGCRVRLIGVPCPVAGVDWNLSESALQAGVGVPLTPWLTAGVRWTIAGGR